MVRAAATTLSLIVSRKAKVSFVVDPWSDKHIKSSAVGEGANEDEHEEEEGEE